MKFDMARVRTRLLLDQPFFGTLAMHMEMSERTDIPTLQTNGVQLHYNPEFMASLTGAEQIGVLAHEVMHAALLHMFRRNDRDPREWNEAADYAINPVLIEAGFTLPTKVLNDPQFKGMSAEQIYAKRRSMTPPPAPKPEPQEEEEEDEQPEEDEDEGDDEQEQDEPGEDDAPGDDEEAGDEPGNEEGDGEGEDGAESIMGDCPTGEFVDGPETAEEPGDLTESDWQVIAEEAALVSERAGTLPGGTGRAIKETREAVLDWRAELQAFVTNCIESDQSWARPNRRFVSRGVYLPGMVKENVGTIAVGVDVSGSVDQAMLDAFAAELNGIMRDARPERMVVLYVDHELQATAEFTPDDEVVLKMTGGGGTCFQPAFDWIEENDVDPLAFVYLTDLYGPAPVEPAYPVLWVTPIFSHAQEPFGTRVVIP